MNQPVNLDGFALQPYLQAGALIGATSQIQGSVIVPEGCRATVQFHPSTT